MKTKSVPLKMSQEHLRILVCCSATRSRTLQSRAHRSLARDKSVAQKGDEMIAHRLCRALFSIVCLVPAAGLAQAAPDASTLGEYVFSTPQGWAAAQYPDGITLTSPAS